MRPDNGETEKNQVRLHLVLNFFIFFLRHERHGSRRGKRGDGVLVNHLLFAVAVDHDGEVVKSPDYPAKLETVYEIDGNRHRFFADLVEKCILNVDGLFQNPYLLCIYILSYCTLFSRQMKLSCNQLLNFFHVFLVGHIEPMDFRQSSKP